jgi:small subunit ribosomal protein S1
MTDENQKTLAAEVENPAIAEQTSGAADPAGLSQEQGSTPVPAAPADAKAEEKRGFNATGRALKRLLDDDIESEMEAALANFDGGQILAEPATPQSVRPAAGTTEGPKGGRPSPDKQTVRVLAVRGDDIYVDLGQKSEGVVSILQFENEKLPAAGDLIELIVDHFDRDNNLYILRRPGSVQEADWGSVAKGMIVDAVVRKVNKGGLEVTVNGIRGFLPAGQVDIAHIPDLSIFLNKTLRCEITEVSLTSKNLIVSRKVILEREREEKARDTLASLAEGQLKQGVVKKIMDFGAFVDIGGVDGLIHVSQMSWQKVHHPGDLLSPGQEVQVVVLSFDPETKKIGLGLRQLTESPWKKAAEKYRVGATVTGTVSKIMDFGAFVELESGIEGLIHISELSSQRVRRVAEVLKVGQSVDVKVLEFDEQKQRISLSLKAAAAEAEEARLEAEDAEAERLAAEAPPKPQSSKPLKGGLRGGGGPLFG